MKRSFIILLIITSRIAHVGAQELYVYTEPASNMPANSVSAKITGHLVGSEKLYGNSSARLMPEVQVGISKKFMFRIGTTFSNMHNADFRYESWNVYAKYRFLSNDDIHTHFRMAAYAEGSSTRSPFHYEEINLMGDKSGVQVGLVATQLWHKFALSGNFSHSQVLDESRNNDVIYIPRRLYQSLNYSLSAGYLKIGRAHV